MLDKLKSNFIIMNKYFIIIIFLIWLFYYKIEHFSQQKIISVYSPESYFGIGDYIRGIIHLYQNESSEKIFINYQTNIISKYLYNNYGNDHPIINKPIITNENNYTKYIINDITCLYHNAAIQYPIKKEILSKIKQMFVMKPNFKKFFNKKLKEINIHNKKFIILHLRYNDEVFKNDHVIYDYELETYIEENIMNENTLSHNVPTILVISNSNMTKEYLCKKYNFKQYKLKPAHTGAIGKYSPDDIKDTLLEFFTITKASKIYQYCEDRKQVSGFSKRISEIYNIPITII